MANVLGVDEPAVSNLPQRIVRCEECGLEFSHPMRDPGESFYTWLTNSSFRYPKRRWEWSEAANILERVAADREIVVLDAGSGEGRFLEMIARIPGVVPQGIDQNPAVIEASRARGLDVRHGDLSVAGLQGLRLDVITFWHVVEHVSDPVGLLQRARDCLNENGMILFSVPITPMSYEHAWPDPFNMPPHHLTRWSVTSLEALASRLGMTFGMSLPAASSIPTRTLRSLVLQATDSLASSSAFAKGMAVLRFVSRNPMRLVSELRHQLRRQKHGGRVLPDVVLVSLRKHE